MGFRLDWKGEAIKIKVRVAAAGGVDETLDEAVRHSQSIVAVDTGATRGSIQKRPTRVSGSRVSGSFGAGTPWAIFLETGTVHMSARPFIRPAGDAQFPQLAGRIAKRFL